MSEFIIPACFYRASRRTLVPTSMRLFGKNLDCRLRGNDERVSI